MSHWDEGTLQAWIDDQLRGAQLAAVEAHVAECAACAAEVRILRELDARAREAFALVAGAPAADAAVLGGIRRRSRSGALRLIPTGLARAAMLLLALAGVVGAAIPGSPLRQWIAEQLGGEAQTPTPADPVVDPVEAPVAVPEEPAQEGLGVMPDAGRISVRLISPSPAATIRIQLGSESRAQVMYPSTPDVRTRSAPGRLDLIGLGDGTVTIVIPRDALEATVEVDGRAWWQKLGGEVRVLGPGATSRGNDVVFGPRR